MKWGIARKITLCDVKEKLKGTKYEDDAKRQLRERLLNAFDIYKSNVYYGVLTETEAEHNIILGWYKNLLDLQTDAIQNPPEKVAKYVK